MIGLTVLLIAVFWFWLARKISSSLVKESKNKVSHRIASIFLYSLVVITPFGDEILGRIQFNHLCNTEAKAWVSPNVNEITSAREGINKLGPREGLIFPVTEQAFTYVDSKTGITFYSVKAFHTPGGWIMRHGLGLGNSSSCWPEHWASQDFGFNLDSMLHK